MSVHHARDLAFNTRTSGNKSHPDYHMSHPHICQLLFLSSFTNSVLQRPHLQLSNFLNTSDFLSCIPPHSWALTLRYCWINTLTCNSKVFFSSNPRDMLDSSYAFPSTTMLCKMSELCSLPSLALLILYTHKHTHVHTLSIYTLLHILIHIK